MIGDFNEDGRPDFAGLAYQYDFFGELDPVVWVYLNDSVLPPPPEPGLRITDLTLTEGNTGTQTATFVVTRVGDTEQTATVDFVTANGAAQAGSDYQVASGTLTFAPGESHKTIDVLINGDTNVEPDETFFVNLSNASGATIVDGQGIGTIINDDVALPTLSISDVTKTEGKNKTTSFTFTVTLSAPSTETVTVSYATANGTALDSDNDYYAKSGTLTFNPGETTRTITITVRGDRKAELDETFFVNLFSASGATIEDAQGIGTILNDDGETQALQRAFSDPTLIEEVQTGKRRR